MKHARKLGIRKNESARSSERLRLGGCGCDIVMDKFKLFFILLILVATPDKAGPRNTMPSNEGTKHEKDRDLSQIRESFRDLVIYNEQGQPAIDINRLVYKPKKVKHYKEKEKLSWYLPDYIFIIFNFLSLTYSTYFVLNGLTIISWRNSMECFALKNCTSSCSCENKETEEICRTIKEEYENLEDMIPFTIIRFKGFNDVSNHGLGLLIVGICNIVNVILGISACLNGNKSLLIWHLVIDVILFVIEVGLMTLLLLTGRCEDKDIKIVKMFLEMHVKNYGKDEGGDSRDTTELDLIQISLTCCGVGNWTDYLPRSTWENGELKDVAVGQRHNLDKSDLIIPSSCCRQWWVRNIYCAHEAHMLAQPTATDLQAHQFRQRISQWGCLPKMVALCRNMLSMVGIGGVIAWILHLIFSIVRHICAIVQIQTINTLIRERNRILRHKESHFAGEVGNGGGEDDEKDLFPSLSTLLDPFTEVPQTDKSRSYQIPVPPKEKEIANMKSRRDYNKLQKSMADTNVANWVATGRAFVEGKKSSNGKVGETSGARNRKKDLALARREEQPNIQHAIDDHDEYVKHRNHVPVPRDNEDDRRNTIEALQLIQHVKHE